MKVSVSNNAGNLLNLGMNVSGQSGSTSVSGDFKSYLDTSKDSQVGETSTAYAKDETESVSQSAESEDVHNSTEDVKEARDVNETQSKDAESVKSDDAVSDVESPTDAELEEDVISEDTLDSVVQLLSQIQTQLQELLGLTQEELAQVLADHNMQPMDLLNMDSLKEVILDVKGATPLDMLTDENLAQLVKDVMGQVQTQIEAANLPSTVMTEEGLTEDVYQALVTQVEAVADEMTDNVQTTETKQAMQGDQSLEQNLQVKEPEVSVVVDKNGSQQTKDSKGNQEFAFDKNQVINQLTQSVQQASEVAYASETTAADIVQQVVEQIKLTAKADTTSMEVQLYPEHLGKISIQVASKNGAVTAQITTETEMAKAALEASIQTLKEAFNNQELKVESIEVMVGTPDFSQGDFEGQQTKENDEKHTSGVRRLDLSALDDLEELSEEDALNAEMMQAEGRSVDYTA